jgi:hypothetical protein
MTNYRIYRLDGAGHFVWGRDFASTNDEDALAEARVGLRVFEKAEVWVGARCVGQVSGKLSR